MQSSAVVTLRALVMLSCLILVPLAAMFGSMVPQVFNSIIEGRGVSRLVRKNDDPNDARTRGGDAPAFAAGPASSEGPPPLSSAGDASASLWAPALAHAAGSSPGPAEGQPPSSGPSMVSHAAPAERRGLQAPPARPGEPRAAGDTFQGLQSRLRELGMTYSLLETAGAAGQAYRFYCKISLGADPGHSRHFDATDADPLRAMRDVVAQVEQWRRAR